MNVLHFSQINIVWGKKENFIQFFASVTPTKVTTKYTLCGYFSCQYLEIISGHNAFIFKPTQPYILPVQSTGGMVPWWTPRLTSNMLAKCCWHTCILGHSGITVALRCSLPTWAMRQLEIKDVTPRGRTVGRRWLWETSCPGHWMRLRNTCKHQQWVQSTPYKSLLMMAVRDFMSGSLDEAKEYMQGPTVSTVYTL